MSQVKVTQCQDCPFLQQNGEFPQSWCSLARNDLWPMGFYQNGEPAPPSCPLRKGPAQVVLNTRRVP